MTIRLNEDYYYWCCDWCDTENRVLWARLHSGVYCGACHRPMELSGGISETVCNQTVSAGLC